MTKEEADILIDHIQDIEELWVSNDKLREEKYKETMKSCECKDWVKDYKDIIYEEKGKDCPREENDGNG